MCVILCVHLYITTPKGSVANRDRELTVETDDELVYKKPTKSVVETVLKLNGKLQTEAL